MDTDLATGPLRSGVLRLDVVTPAGVAVRKDVDQVEAPSVDGEFGVLPGHLPLLAALRAGVVRYRSEGKTFVLAVGAGFAEAGGDAMTILTDRCLDAKDVDLAKTRSDLDAASKKLDAFAGAQEGAEFEELSRSAQWFQAQLDAARESGRG
ncbi:MAG: ATP synthase F1 subunit epsilon [Deltaproteobacteria bacterium]|nr:ATP synthase F1 subunit epsilon [Deltaproteobacteria bacterium]MBK7067392.1 ATP synthase F1 subunit epsilon [Deltaproteobacteria bacterium]MBP6834515.1 ATP synthase F1 subunit epsilon [Deltaproteobacteria bacterium]